tara:strand:+ start:27002 stop:28369 length:1368 start_codon:yes stop_codon:yes gene_type:complete
MVRYNFLVIILACIIIFTACEPRENPDLVIQNVSLLSMEDDQIREGQTIFINDGIISWIGPASEARYTSDATVVEGNYYVMPGLAEMHAHIPPENQGEQQMLDALTLYLSQGITTIRGMLGQPAHLELREQAAAGAIISPRIFTSGPSFNGNSVVDSVQAREMVRNQAEAGYDLLKLHPGLTLEQFNAIASEANNIGINFSGHISHDVGLVQSLEAGQGTIDHLDRYMEFLAGNPDDREDPSIIYFGYDLAYDADENRIEEAAVMTREAGVWNVPTNTLLHNVFNPDLSTEIMREWPGMEYMPPQTVEGWVNFVNNFREQNDYNADKAKRFLELRNLLTKALHDVGAGLLLGADAPQIFNPPGFSAHRELELLVAAGLTPYEALKTGTVNVAEYFGEQDKAGIIAVGYRADLILLDVNPLESIPFHNRIMGVISDGDYISRDEFDEMLNNILERR